MRNRLRELAEFPFTKIQPADFRLQVASSSPVSRPLRVVITSSDFNALEKNYQVLVVKRFPHLSCATYEVPAAEIMRLAASDLVDAIWSDRYELSSPNPNPRVMGGWLTR